MSAMAFYINCTIKILLISTIFVSMTYGSAVLISDMTMSVMVELSSRHPFCKMHTDRGDIQRMLLQSDPRRIRQVPRESVMELEEVCFNSGNQGQAFRGGLGFIYPGTKWCGPGTVATSYNDLGHHVGEDSCCREHDHCPNVLNVGECKRGLCNTGTFTRSHCECDARLRRCLQSLNSETANTLGAIFYNVVQVTCFQERSPCSRHQRFEDFYYNTQPQCPIEFQQADFYVPPNAGNLIQKILNKPYGIRKFFPAAYNEGRYLGPPSYLPPIKQQWENFSRRLGVKIASVGLAAVNIIREIVQSPRVVWDTLQSRPSRELPPDVASNDVIDGYYYNEPSYGYNRERENSYY